MHFIRKMLKWHRNDQQTEFVNYHNSTNGLVISLDFACNFQVLCSYTVVNY